MKVKERLATATRMALFGALLGEERLRTGVAFNPMRRSFRVNDERAELSLVGYVSELLPMLEPSMT